jgi:hypothetical protein
MQPRIQELLRLTTAADHTVREEAVRQIALLLEKHAACPDQLSFYESVMLPDLVPIVLSKDEQEEMLAHLADMTRHGKATPGILWALGKATPQSGLPPVLILLRDHRDTVDDTTVWQALMVLGNFLGADPNAALAPEITSLLHDYNAGASLQGIIDTRSPRHGSLAQQLLDRMP